MPLAKATRALLIVLLMAGLQPPRPLVWLGPPQTVVTQHPVVCVHTRLTDEAEPWKILRTLELVRQMGATTIVEYFPWAYSEGRAGTFDFSHAETIIDDANHQGLTVIARLGGLVPAWARVPPGGDPAEGATLPDTTLPPERYADFANYVGAFVAHFKGRVAHIIIWNEPNVILEWGFQLVSPEGYTALLREAYTRAKAANPDVLVLAGALAPTLEPEGSGLALNDLLYLERMYAAGAGAYFDALAAHAYGLRMAPEDAPGPEALNFRRIEVLRALLDAHGDNDKKIFLTESGWNDSPRWIHAVKPAQRIEYTLAGYAWAEAHWPTVPVVCTWAFRYPAPQYSYGDYFTLVTSDFQTKPIYEAIQAWTQP